MHASFAAEVQFFQRRCFPRFFGSVSAQSCGDYGRLNDHRDVSHRWLEAPSAKIVSRNRLTGSGFHTTAKCGAIWSFHRRDSESAARSISKDFVNHSLLMLAPASARRRTMSAHQGLAIGEEPHLIDRQADSAAESRRMKIFDLYEDDDPSAGPRCLVNGVALGVIVWAVIAAIWVML
jgi:hypothetical protein